MLNGQLISLHHGCSQPAGLMCCCSDCPCRPISLLCVAHLRALCRLSETADLCPCLLCYAFQAEEAEIENLIQKEQKQVERMEWLLQTVQKDYAYFNYLQKRFEDETGSVRKY